MSRAHEKITFDSELGHKAKVERAEIPISELITFANEALREMGQEIGKHDPGVRHLTYSGSFATHIFASEHLKEKDGTPKLVFFHQTTTLGNTHELVAGAAGQDCLKAIARKYGRKPPAKRSGF